MNFSDINPFSRFAAYFCYQPLNTAAFPGDCRIIYVVSGEAEVFVENKHYILNENSLFYCSAGVVYKICSEKPFHLYVLNFDLSQENKHHTETIPIIAPEKAKAITIPKIDGETFLNNHFFLADGAIFKNAIAAISEEMIKQKPFFREKAGGILKQLIADLHRLQSSETKISSDLSPVLDFIHKSYTEKITNGQLARIAGYHEYHLNRIFSAKTGMSIHKYILSLRIKKAKALLLGSDTSLSEIAELCGFESNTYFSSYFKKESGCTPMQYRKKYKHIL